MKKLNESFKKKKLIVFDLDGTLTETKSNMDSEMAGLFSRLLQDKQIAVIGGGKYALFREQLLRPLRRSKRLLHNLFLFPTTATSFYRYRKGWEKIYAHELSKRERAMIKKAFHQSFDEIGYIRPRKIYGKIIEDRRTQVTFSALGQDVVAVLGERGVLLKKEWRDKNTAVKLKLAKTLQKHLSNLEVRAAGYTSVDVTRKGIDKAYGIRQIEKHLGIRKKDMVFVGDALFRGGNDYAARKTGVECVSVSGPEETKKFIRFLLKN